MILHGYWRSGAAYRVRIALALKRVAYDQVNHDLRTGGQADPAYVALNPQRLVPALEVDGLVLTQSIAILEWLDERFPDPPLLPADADGRAIVRAMAATLATDVHPLHNLRTLKALRQDFDASEAQVDAWMARWMTDGFAAIEALIARHGGDFAYGDTPTLADCVTVPALYSAVRFGVDTGPYPRLVASGARTAALAEAAHPGRQPDADA
ncbi:maleylacetoacetate isomerase [Sphingomonas sp. CD22]|uniref:maleylacetoacetate isomerase n=1 Tax=Sphingomonas sp. CD22 TaxID=3100214 RepID=UPI002ADFFC8E|nr:maleylacetoacetate isomerase [Sphingomonas sp. CD22]MEA1083325.1 maleylacetoacetate isomerase [Sphingomonas sp. CD22]